MNLALPRTDWLFVVMASLCLFSAKANATRNGFTDTLVVKTAASKFNVEFNGESRKFLLAGLSPDTKYHIGIRTGNIPLANQLSLRLDDRHATVTQKFTHSLQFYTLRNQIVLLVENQGRVSGQFDLIVTAEKTDQLRMPPPGIATDPNYSAQELIEDIFIGGACFEVVEGSIHTIGSWEGIGFFSSGMSSIGVESGVLLATGEINRAEGPNDSDFETGHLNGQNDPDLDDLGTGTTEDAVGIEFEFVPTTDIIQFDYVFASEEYCQYVNTGFNDVFGFFISGPGINGPYADNAINIATVPGSNTFVSINTINKFQNSAYYKMNEREFEAMGCGYASNQVAPQDIQYDGFTTPLTAIANVIPCETYKIRLVIADVGDQLLDSGVFLAANSFASSGGVQMSAVVPVTGSDEAYEVCDGAYFQFLREGNDLSEDYPVNINIDPSSTATSGLDYEALPEMIIIPAGQSEFLLPVNILSDNLTEGSETLTLYLDQPCTCENRSVDLVILDSEPLVIEMADMSSCAGTEFVVSPVVSGGLPGYTYTWNDGFSGTSFNVTPASDISYTLTVTDLCGNITVENVNIVLDDGPVANIQGDGLLCDGDAGTELIVNLLGNAPWSLIYLHNGNPIEINDITEPTYTLPVSDPGLYELFSVETPGCDGAVSGQVEISYTTMAVSFESIPVTCYAGNDGAVAIDVSGDNGGYSFAWSNGSSSKDINALTAGNYLLTVTDDLGCTAVTEVEVEQAAPIVATINEVQAINCYGEASASLNVNATGGSGFYQYMWSNGETGQSLENVGAGIYTLSILDSNGCLEVVSVDVAQPAQLVASAESINVVNCFTPDNGEVNLNVSGGTGTYIFAWSNGDDTEDVQNLESGNYIVTITDANACSVTTTATVEGDFVAPDVSIEPAEILTCTDTVVSLAGNLSDLNIDYALSWSANDGNIILFENTLNPEVDAPGAYELLITDTNNGCTGSATIEVVENILAPAAQATAPAVINCYNSEITLDGSGSSDTQEMSYQWTTTDGQIIDGEDSLAPVVDVPTAYTLIVTNAINGCTASAEVMVADDLETPMVEIVAAQELNCYNDFIALDATGSSSGPDIEYLWQTGDGAILNGENSVTPNVGAEGTYTFTVLNTSNGCTASGQVDVAENYVAPMVDAGPDLELNCGQPNLTLQGAAQGVDLVFEWIDPDGELLPGGNIPNLVIDQSGTYHLLVTDMSNGCSRQDAVIVAENFTKPAADAGEDGKLNCAITALNLGGTSTDQGPQFHYQWTTPDGNFDGNTDEMYVIADEPGMYYLMVENMNNGCMNYDTVQVLEDLFVPEVAAVQPDMLNCLNTQQLVTAGLSADGDYSYLWTTNDGHIVSGASSIELIVDEPGDYTLNIINNGNNCATATSVVVAQDIVAPLANVEVADVLTCSQTIVSLNAGNSSFGPGFIYQWTTPDGNIADGDTSLAPDVDSPGDYQLEVTNIENGCTSAATIAVSENVVLPTVNPGLEGLINCYEPVFTLDGGASSLGENYNYEWTAPDGTILNTENEFTTTTTVPGTFTLSITDDQNGCTAIASAIVIEDKELTPVALLPETDLNCYNPEVELTANPETAQNLSYEWSSQNGNILSGNGTETIALNMAGIYQLTYANVDNGCAATIEIPLTENFDSPLAEAGGTSELNCAVTTIELNGNGSSTGNNFVYSWTTPDGEILDGETSLTPEINASGTYQLTVLNQDNGCVTIDEVFISEDTQEPLAAIAIPAVLDCAVTEVVLDATASDNGANFSYEWTTPDGQIVAGEQTVSPNVNEPGIYQLQITDSNNNCTNTMTVTVEQNITTPTAEAQLPDILNCQNQSVVLDASASSQGGEYSYEWSTPDGSILSGGTSVEAVVDEAATYELLVTNLLNSCTATTTVQVDSDSVTPEADAGSDMELNCYNPSLSLDGSASSTGSDFSYSWSTTSGNITGGQNSQFPVVDQPGSYALIVTNEINHCKSEDVVTLSANFTAPVPQVVTQDLLLTCTQTNLQLDATSSQPSGQLAFNWSGIDGGIVVGAATATPEINESGIYLLEMTDQENGCTATQEVFVDEDVDLPALTIATPDVLDCINGKVGLNANVTNVSDNYTINWSSQNGNLISGVNSLFAEVDTSGIYLLEILNEDNGCSNTLATEVLENRQLPEITIEEPIELDCVTEDVDLISSVNASSNDLSYTWGGESLISPLGAPHALVNEPGVYELVVTDMGNGCSAMETVLVRENLNVPTAIELDLQPPLCYNGMGALTITTVEGGAAPYLYSLDGGESFWTAEKFAELNSGNYDVIVQDAIGCEYAESFFLPNAPERFVDLGENVEIELGDDFQLKAAINFSSFLVAEIAWTPANLLSCANCLNPVAKPVKNTVYEVSITDVNGCEMKDNVIVTIDTDRPVYIPNAFSPNNDGLNDGFTVFAKEKQINQINSLSIFNRWGGKVFERQNFPPNDPNLGWNGRSVSTTINPGVYVFWTEVEFIDGTTQLFKGDVTLVR